MTEKRGFIVGIGAGAGGLAALREFFEHLPENPSAAFVLLQHPNSEEERFTPDLLRAFTRLPISLATHGKPAQTNCIYLAPENQLLTYRNGRFNLEDLEPDQLFPPVIDVFLVSLAKHQKEKAVGIILSGGGVDGASGAKTIHEMGGMVMVQQSETAQNEEMPEVAMAVDNPDWAAPPREMGKRLIDYLNDPGMLHGEKSKIDLVRERDVIGDIVQLVSDFSRVNFKQYKINTVLRRIERRMNINHLDLASEYREFLRNHPEELRVLYNELLIGVTSFFRDPTAFEALTEKVFPQLCERKEYDPIRIWVPACSTGEEAYSIAIVLDEYIRQHQLEIDFKIFATDLDNRSIEFASYGRYRNTIGAEVSAERLKKYFIQTGEFYEVRKEIRRKIIFAKHNLLNDPPFIKLDLLSCRNLFIYLKADLQKKIALSFSYALKINGFLFMGAHESPNDVDAVFEPADHKWKIFRNKAGNSYRHYSINSTDVPQRYEPGSHSVHPTHATMRRQQVLQQPAQTESDERYSEILVNEYAPSCLFVNHNNEVTYIHGNLEKYLQIPRKRISFSLFNMIPENLTPIFRNGIRKVIQGNTNVAFKSVAFTKDNRSFPVNLNFKLVTTHFETQTNGHPMILIEFRDNQSHTDPAFVIEGDSQDQSQEREIQTLESDLKQVRKELQFTIDELETINEELQASNEEMLSSNEEMQSANEELQSSNEELFTLNVELKNKIDELTLLHNDIKNLLTSTEIATIFLDLKLNIRRFTPSAKSHFNFLDTDVGRPLAHLTHQFLYHDFEEDANEVLRTLIPIRKEISKQNGQFFLLRILPYHTEESKIVGVVITIVDVTELKSANLRLTSLTQDLEKRTEELKASEQQWRSLVNNTPDLITRFDRQMRVTFLNLAVEQEFNLSASELLGKTLSTIGGLNEKDEQEWNAQLQQVFLTRKPVNYYQEMTILGEKKYLFNKLIPEQHDGSTEVDSVLCVSRDVSTLKLIELELKRSEANLRSLLDNTPDMITRFDNHLRYTFVNKAHELEMAQPVEHFLGKTVLETEAYENGELMHTMLQKSRDKGKILNYYFSHKSTADSDKYYFSIVVPELAEDGSVKSLLSLTRDVTQLKQFEMELMRSEQNWKSLVNNTPDLFARLDKDLKYVFVNEAVEKEFGVKAGDILGKTPLQLGMLGKHESRQLMLDMRKVFKTGTSIKHYTTLDKGGQPCYLFVQLVPEFGVQGDQPESILFIARDITAMKNYEIELNQKNDDLQRINEYLDNFVYAAAHDLQSPVVSLKILTSFLNDPDHQQNKATYLDRLTTEVERLEKTLNGLVELIRVQSMEENIRVVSFNEILDHLKEEFGHKLMECNGLIQANFEAFPNIGYIKTYLLIIIRNLMSNAIKYRSPDRQLVIRLSTVKHENYVLLTFSDNGQGIDLKKNGKNLFKPFKQLSNQVEGIGLGLHLIKYTIERNGGKIELESRPGVGTTFMVYLKEYK